MSPLGVSDAVWTPGAAAKPAAGAAKTANDSRMNFVKCLLLNQVVVAL
jgi:hypothetical protein